MTKPWDKYREIIVAEYKEQNRPLHEVQRIMRERYGFKASTRAYRSRFDRWGIHKYSRRRRMRSMSISRRNSIADDGGRLSPQESPDVEESSSQVESAVLTPNELFNTGLCGATSSVGFRSPLCLIKPEFQYSSIAPSPNSIVTHSPAFSPNRFGIPLDCPFDPQSIDCYSPHPAAIFRQAHQDMMAAAPGPSLSGQGGISQNGMQTGYAYSLSLLTGSRE